MNDWRLLVAVACGGAVGALARFGVTTLLAGVAGRQFYLSTLLINVLGSFALGLLYAGTQRMSSHWLMALLGVGVLGAFTTFSTFALEVVRLLQAARILEATGYAVGSTLLAVLAAALGFRWLTH